MAAARVPTQSPPQEGHGGHRRFPIQCPFLPFPITEPHLYRRQCWARPQACFSGRLTPSSHLTTSGQWEASRSKSPETSERVFTFLIQKIQPEPPLPFLAYKHMSHLQLWQLSCDPEAMSMGTKTSFLRNCLVTTSTHKCPDFLCRKTHKPCFCLSHYSVQNFLLLAVEQITTREN